MSAPEVELRAAWRQLVGNANEPRLDQLLDQLLASHREEHRHYHTATHVMWVLRHIAHMLAAGEQATDAAAIRLAALYHDAVYDPSATDNEARSAQLAGEAGAALGWPAARRQVVQRLVEATAAHQPRDRDEAVLIDADLAILGASPNDYAAYVRGVRAEYAHVPESAWRTGRAAVLRGFLARPHLFTTTCMRDAREARARANIAAELAQLGV
ncbi:MAG: hypothetical protein KAY11_06275 [Ilumatobacteraceae bacterium]|nr:metal-dependent phosphohydrolase [Acidimicrobiaceae bacterium]MBP6486498.1 hypothetical protein [Ilumatobacteraceae bacterium]MBP7888076.1 hypothetical protein [Ilumatobacteraceae bacterium]MBP8209152.1 hypothetical protein [Ilumatobacteraceae bacterium]HQY14455.1 hypothetical protein [Ilumatobacteraceae bacterium]